MPSSLDAVAPCLAPNAALPSTLAKDERKKTHTHLQMAEMTIIYSLQFILLNSDLVQPFTKSESTKRDWRE
jgi:hypothetical protein